MPGIIRKVAEYCWSNNFLDVFRKFFQDHAPEFENAPPFLEGDEHNLEYYSLFQTYLGIYENLLTKFVTAMDCTIEDFYREVRDTQRDFEEDPSSADEYLQYFIDCLLASADYDSFYRVMAKQGRLYRISKADVKDYKTAEAPAKKSTSHSAKAEGKYDDDEK